MRIGYVIWSLGLGGAEQVVLRLAAGMVARGHDATVFTLNEPGTFAEDAARQGVPVVSVAKRHRYDGFVIHRLAREFRARRLDVVHTHLWGGNLWGRLAARRARVPRVLATEHNVDTWKRPYHLAIDRWLAPKTDALIAVSRQVQAFYESRGVGPRRWQVVYNGIDAEAAPARHRGDAYAALGLGASDTVIGWIGRLVPAKAPNTFLEAMLEVTRRAPSARGLIVGDGPLRQEVEGKITRLGLDRQVIMAGFRKDVPALLAGMDVLVFTSEREGLSIAMLEAMAAGVPVVATRVGGTPELIESGVSGLLVEPGRSESLADRLIELLEQPGRLEAMQAAARARVRERFALTRMLDLHEALYRGEPTAVLARGEPDGAGETPKPTVMLVIDHLDVGGAQRQLVGLARTLCARRWPVVVISLSAVKTAYADELRRAGITVHTVPQAGALDLACLWTLMRLMRRHRPGIVHTWLFTADTYGRVAAWLTGHRRIVTGMRNTIDDLPRRHRLVNRWLTRVTAAITVNADAIRPGLAREGGIPEAKIRTIYNGLDLSALGAVHRNGALRELWHVPPGGRVVAMVARLSAQKDHRTFLEAVRRAAPGAPEAVFLIIGDGPLREELTRAVAKLGLVERVRMLGERRDVWELLHHIDLFVLSTHYEGCSNAIMEAMAAGRPVIATDVGGNRELVADGETGLLVPHEDPERLAEAMLALLRDPATSEAMGARGRERIEQRFSLEATARRTEALYQELLA